jgi:oligoribonuclease NrnB/cAMP/cGMP phosphodiesterase (DHH superfamily)
LIRTSTMSMRCGESAVGVTPIAAVGVAGSIPVLAAKRKGQETMICFYHGADLDGHCSGAIVKTARPSCELVGINYGDEFPWAAVEADEDHEVVMVDFGLEPIERMVELAQRCNLLWIDHHKSAIEEAERVGFNPAGLRSLAFAGCELAWQVFFPYRPMPRAVKLLGRYDVWDHTDPVVLPFQFGLQLEEDTRPENWMDGWAMLFELPAAVDEYVQDGTVAVRYKQSQDAKYAGACAFESELDGKSFIVVNRGLANSQLFDSVWDAERHDAMATFVWRKGQWHVSLYSPRDDVDVGEIAKRRGGGGHKGAAGFQCTELPFALR